MRIAGWRMRYIVTGVAAAIVVIALVIHDIEGRAGTEIDDDRWAAVMFVNGNSIADPVRARGPWLIHVDDHAEFEVQPHHHWFALKIGGAH